MKAQDFIDAVLHCSAWNDERFRLADVGASGGIHQRWRVYGDRLSAVGFDPLLAEVHRLASTETDPRVTYEAAFVGWPELNATYPPSQRCVQPFPRSSAAAAHTLRHHVYIQEMFNAGAPIELTDRRISLDEYFSGKPCPDFIKIDTDGWDFPVLLGAETLLEDVLGVEVEAQFHGAVHVHSNTFSNIDNFLRARGFSLFDLDAYRYSRAALPAPFVSDIAAQTTSGQISWGEAVYLRDLAHPGYDEMFGHQTTVNAALKLCTLFSLFDLPDCAAELLATHPILATLPERSRLLDLLTPAGYPSYDAFIAAFTTDPERLYPTRLRAARSAPSAPGGSEPQTEGRQSGRRNAMRERLRDLKERNRKLKGERDTLRRRCRELEVRLSKPYSARHSLVRKVSGLFRRGS